MSKTAYLYIIMIEKNFSGDLPPSDTANPPLAFPQNRGARTAPEKNLVLDAVWISHWKGNF